MKLSRLVSLIVAGVAGLMLLLPALAAGPSTSSALKKNPRLASLQIEIWPEYDRPAAALVILKGELAADVALPAAVSLRIAAASGGPTAVAASSGPSAGLVNLKHERKNADDFITVSFDATQRLFHIEFYEPLATAKPERSYTYVWPGDFAVDRLHVILQEPAGALFVTAQPGLDATTAGQNGLRYRSSELGAQKVGTQLPIRIGYTKSDPRTSEQILQPKAPEVLPAPATAPAGQSPRWWALVFAIAAALVIASVAGFMWWQGRRKIPGVQPGSAGFCSKCGAQLDSGSHYCSKCGTPTSKSSKKNSPSPRIT